MCCVCVEVHWCTMSKQCGNEWVSHGGGCSEYVRVHWYTTIRQSGDDREALVDGRAGFAHLLRRLEGVAWPSHQRRRGRGRQMGRRHIPAQRGDRQVHPARAPRAESHRTFQAGRGCPRRLPGKACWLETHKEIQPITSRQTILSTNHMNAFSVTRRLRLRMSQADVTSYYSVPVLATSSTT